jgi:hypothetical protein
MESRADQARPNGCIVHDTKLCDIAPLSCDVGGRSVNVT